jgi:hypothetical protein
MFNLGTKQVVLVTRHGNQYLRIQGNPNSLLRQEDKEFLLQKNAVAGVYTITPVTPYDDTKTYDIVLGIRSERVLSNIFSDIDVWTFNLKQVVLTLWWGVAAQIAGFNDQVVKFSGLLLYYHIPSYEGFPLRSIEIRDVTQEYLKNTQLTL